MLHLPPVPLTGPCRGYVSPDGPPGEAALLRPGVWHGTPLAADQEGATLVLLRAGVGTSDTVNVTFPLVP